MTDPVATHFEGLVESHRGQYAGGRRSGSAFCFRKRLQIARAMTAGATGWLLDCAAGTGEISRAVLEAECFEQAVLVDVAPAMIAGARELFAGVEDLPPVSFVESDIFTFSTPQRFDLILCLGLIAHTGRLEELLGRLKALLAPGGRVLLQSTLSGHPFTRIVRALTARRYARRHGYAISYYASRDLAAAAERVGLRTLERRRFSFGLPFADRIWPWGNSCVERLLEGWAARWGTEALLMLEETEA